MADNLVDIGLGVTIGFGTSGFTAEILDVDLSGIELEAFEAAHMGTADVGSNEIGNVPYVFNTLVDAGQVGFAIHFNPGIEPIVNGVAETVTLTFGSGTTWVGTATIMSFDAAVPIRGKMTGNVFVKWSGKITITPAV